MIVLAVVLAAIAVIAGISLVSSEGVRFDGVAQMSPWQPVHLKQQRGDELVIALGDLTPVAIAGAVEAKVMDDEGYGIRELHHLPIERRWAATFKLDGGSMTFSRGGSVQSGFIANMQFGVFVRPWLGFLHDRRPRRRGRRIRRRRSPATTSASRSSRCRCGSGPLRPVPTSTSAPRRSPRRPPARATSSGARRSAAAS